MLVTAAALLFSGVAQAAISPPLSWIWLHPVSWVPAFAVFSRLDGRRALVAGWLVGLAAGQGRRARRPGTRHRKFDLPL